MNKLLKLLAIVTTTSSVTFGYSPAKNFQDTTKVQHKTTVTSKTTSDQEKPATVKKSHSSTSVNKKSTSTNGTLNNSNTSTKKTYRKSTVVKKDTIN
jgi:hypothetical protein